MILQLVCLAIAWSNKPDAHAQAAQLNDRHSPAAMAHAQPGEPRSARRRRTPTYKVAPVDNGGTIEGSVLFMSAPPPPRKVNVVKDHETCDNHPKEIPLIRVDAQHRVADAVVFLGNITEGKAFASPPPRAVIDQRTCSFHPHVQAVAVKQPIEIVNNDPVAHNIQADQRVFTIFNILQPQQGMKAEKSLDKPGLVELKCNVHDWMKGYVYVFVHPYYSVTAEDGAYKLTDVPAGKYELTVWQEHLGEQTFPVEVKAGETARMDLPLKPKS